MNVLRLVLPLLLLSGCATTLQPENYNELISSTQLNRNTFIVSYPKGNNKNREKITDLALLRSAEVALQYGFNYFIVVDAAASEVTQTDHQPADVSWGNGYLTASNSGAGIRPGTSATIICFSQKPKGFAYVALFVKASLRSKYGLDRAT